MSPDSQCLPTTRDSAPSSVPLPRDTSRTSFRSQISSVFKHPHKKDLYIALADRWLPELSPEDSNWVQVFRDAFTGEEEFILAPGTQLVIESLPADLDDPYSLSKYTDERTAEMAE